MVANFAEERKETIVMRKISAAALSLMLSNTAFALVGELTGEIDIIRTHDLTVSPTWVTIKNVTAAGTCGTSYVGVPFVLKDDDRAKRILAIAIAAKMAGKSVVLGWNDVNLGGACSACYVRY